MAIAVIATLTTGLKLSFSIHRYLLPNERTAGKSHVIFHAAIER